MEVQHIRCEDDFKTALQVCEREQKLIFIKFTASWCTPCKRIEPVFMQSLQQITNETKTPICVMIVDVDEAQDLSQKFHITSMPTFQCLTYNEVPDVDPRKFRFVGANDAMLQSWLLEMVSYNQLSQKQQQSTQA